MVVLCFLVVLNVVGVTHTLLLCSVSVCGYTRPTLASPMAPQTSKTNSSGKAKSPKVSSKASANSSGFFLSFPSSTMVAAEETERDQRTLVNDKQVKQTNSDSCRVDAHTQLAVSDAHVALKQVIHLLDGLLLECRRLERTKSNTSSQTTQKN